MKRITAKVKADLNAVKGKSAEEKEEIALIKRRFSEMEEYIESAEYLLNLLLKQGEITPAVVKKISIS
jgi:hypothetical protein